MRFLFFVFGKIMLQTLSINLIPVWKIQIFRLGWKKDLKETRNSFKQSPLNLWWISNKTIMEVGNITKAAIFKNFFHLSFKNTQSLFLWPVLFNIFIRQALTDDFLGLHKNMNCAFPLMSIFFPTQVEI